MTIVWLPLAVKNMDEIYEWHAEKSIQAATKLYNDIYDNATRLKEQPNMAAKEPILTDLSKIYRSLVVRNNYKVVYYTDNDIIYITAIWDCRQNPKKMQRIKRNK